MYMYIYVYVYVCKYTWNGIFSINWISLGDTVVVEIIYFRNSVLKKET